MTENRKTAQDVIDSFFGKVGKPPIELIKPYAQVFSSNGEYDIDQFGRVLAVRIHDHVPADVKARYEKITVFNLAEHHDYWQWDKCPTDFDVLDLEAWQGDNKIWGADDFYRTDIAGSDFVMIADEALGKQLLGGDE